MSLSADSIRVRAARTKQLLLECDGKRFCDTAVEKDMTDPYEAFEIWMTENGYEDVVECKPEDVDSSRLHEALEKYAWIKPTETC